MSKAYDEILSSMKREFFEKCGKRAESFGELNARLETVASEIFSLYCRCDFVLKQAFAQSASGEYLDFHAALRGIERKRAAKATGSLTFTIDEISDVDTEIPEGCLCSLEEEPTIQYITTETGVIPAGEESVTISAEAADFGSEYNVPAGAVTVIVNPPLTVAGVTNDEAFEHGFDDEGDEKLRKRILSSYSIPQTGFSLKSVKEAVMSIDGVNDCNVYKTSSRIYVILNVGGGNITDEIRNAVYDKLYIFDLYGTPSTVRAAQASDYSLKLDVKCNVGEYERISAEVENSVRKYTGSQRIGENLILSKISYSASCVDGVEYCEIASGSALDGVIYCDNDKYLRLSGIEVDCHE